MKKLISLTGFIVFLIALSLVSCKKEDTSEELLPGKWNVASQKITEYLNDVKQDEYTETFDPGEMVIEIFADGTGTVTEGETEDTFEWVIDGDKVTITPADDDPMEFTFTVNEDTLTLTMSEEETYEGDVYKYVMEMVLNRV